MKRISVQLIALLLLAQAVHAQLGAVYAVASGDSVAIWNTGIEANCASRFVFDVGIFADSLRVVERDTSTRLARCTCGFDLSVTVAHLQPGSYTARVYRSHLVPYYTIYYVGSATFIIRGQAGGQTNYSGFQSDCSPNAVERGPSSTQEYSLGQNYPNPFNPVTNVQFSIVNRQLTILKVYDLLGREVATLVNEVQEAGFRSATFDASSLAGGVYFYRLHAGEFVSVKRMVVIK